MDLVSVCKEGVRSLRLVQETMERRVADRSNPECSGEKHGQLIIDERLEENETN